MELLQFFGECDADTITKMRSIKSNNILSNTEKKISLYSLLYELTSKEWLASLILALSGNPEGTIEDIQQYLLDKLLANKGEIILNYFF